MSVSQMEPELDAISRTVAVYDSIADAYAREWLHDRGAAPFLDRFVAHLGRPGPALDLGCGPGRDVLAMSQKGVEAVGVDLSRRMLELARENAPHSIFRCMDVRSLSYPAETFAGAWSCAAFNHLRPADSARTLAEVHRVLVPGGLLALAVEEGGSEVFDHLGRLRTFYNTATLDHLLASAGFVALELTHTYSSKETLGKPRRRRWLQILARKVALGGPAHRDDGCVLCPPTRLRLRSDLGLPSSGAILWGDDELFVVPDIAPLTEGHLLIVTTKHWLSYGDCDRALEPAIARVKDRVRLLFQEVYQQPALFVEHGPAGPRQSGACVHHAHLHCLPLSVRVRDRVERLLGSGRPASLAVLRELQAAGSAYVYVEEDGQRGWAYHAAEIPSQFLRQAIAASLRSLDWRWQTMCRTEDSKARYRRGLLGLIRAADGSPVAPLPRAAIE